LLFEAVEILIQEVGDEGRFRVKFWLVGKEYNEEAIAFPNKPVGDYGLQKIPALTTNTLERSINY
jgi:hypothetical protein